MDAVVVLGDLDGEPKTARARSARGFRWPHLGQWVTKRIMNSARNETSVWVPEEKLTVAEAV